MYHVRVHSLAQRVLDHLRRAELLRAGGRVGVAVSGGIDSVALLRLLIELRHELGIVLSVVHFNHKMRGAESDSDQQFVAGLALEYGLEFYCENGDVKLFAAEEHCGVEAAARELRYAFFRWLLEPGEDLEEEIESAAPQGLKPESLGQLNGTAEAVPFSNSNPATAEPLPKPMVPGASRAMLNKIATGHTLDDQAETVLMRIIRGTGPRGLGGIYPRLVVDQGGVENDSGEDHGEIVRPLLGIRRSQLEQYLAEIKQPWREDSTNSDTKFTRNRLRSLVMPLLQREFNPALAENLAELAEIARDEEDYWDNEISGWLGTVVQWSQPEWTRKIPAFGDPPDLVQIQRADREPHTLHDPKFLERLEQPGPGGMNASVSRAWLLSEPKAVQRRVLKEIGEQAGIPLEFKHIEEIMGFAAQSGPSGKELSLPLGWKIVREVEALLFVTPDLSRQERVADYEYSLPVPGRVRLPELGIVIEALRLTSHVNPESQIAEYNPQQLLRGDLLPMQLIVRNWRAGDRFWPAHTKAPKKIKELLQERRVTHPERRLWPVAASRDEIVWMRGFPVPARLHAEAGAEAVLIREMPWEVDERTT
jgi:tRNA(Ile)-lysidine synthase